jgi:hypothetical protein
MGRSGPVPDRADTEAVELRPTPESRRIAQFTAAGSLLIAIAAVTIAVATSPSAALRAAPPRIAIAPRAT